jgi:hypothetical protein
MSSDTGTVTGRMGTRPANSSKHPGLTNKPTTRRSSAEVQADAKAKEVAKRAKKEAHQNRIKRVADFESNVKANEDLTDATPRPNFAPRGNTNLDSDDGHNPGAPSDSDFNQSTETPVPKGRKKVIPAKTKPLATIVESGDESEPILSKKARAPPKKMIILEETDSDDFAPPLRNWIPRAKRGYATKNEAESESATDESGEVPPSKKPKVAKVSEVDMEQEVKKPGKQKTLGMFARKLIVMA